LWNFASAGKLKFIDMLVFDDPPKAVINLIFKTTPTIYLEGIEGSVDIVSPHKMYYPDQEMHYGEAMVFTNDK